MTTAAELLPPDPAISGLWWVIDRANQHDVWRWWPTSRLWLDTLGARIAASSAHAAGWRCVGPAVPPSGQDAPAPAAEAPPAGSSGAGGGVEQPCAPTGPTADWRAGVAFAEMTFRIAASNATDTIDDMRDRIARAVACLDAAPDPAGDPTWQEVAATVAANRAAWVVLTEGHAPEPVKVPEQVRGRMPGKREGR